MSGFLRKLWSETRHPRRTETSVSGEREMDDDIAQWTIELRRWTTAVSAWGIAAIALLALSFAGVLLHWPWPVATVSYVGFFGSWLRVSWLVFHDGPPCPARDGGDGVRGRFRYLHWRGPLRTFWRLRNWYLRRRYDWNPGWEHLHRTHCHRCAEEFNYCECEDKR